jgi:hypothetical protein
MIANRLKYIALAVLLAVGLAGFGIRHWASASDRTGNGPKLIDGADSRVALQLPGPAVKEKEPVNPPAAGGKEPAKADEAKPGAAGRRREAVIRLPSGAFIKEVDAAPYGSGRLTWIYEEERVQGFIEGSVMGVEFELATEAEYSLSSTGVIYGVLTSVRLNHLRLPDGGAFEELRPFVGLWSAVEPLVNEVLVDLPFSYHFRVQGDRLVISNFRILLAGPNPLGKLGGLAAAKDGSGGDAFAVLAAFQALGTALEGTYTATEAKDRPAPNKRPLFRKPGSAVEPKMTR